MSAPNTRSKVSGPTPSSRSTLYHLDFSIQGVSPISDQLEEPEQGTEAATASGLATAIARIQAYRAIGWTVEKSVMTACGETNVEEVDDFQATVMIWPTPTRTG
jgi:hypothetical protein